MRLRIILALVLKQGTVPEFTKNVYYLKKIGSKNRAAIWFYLGIAAAHEELTSFELDAPELFPSRSRLLSARPIGFSCMLKS